MIYNIEVYVDEDGKMKKDEAFLWKREYGSVEAVEMINNLIDGPLSSKVAGIMINRINSQSDLSSD